MRWLVTFDILPESACIDGVEYPIGYGYRSMMAAEIEMFRQDISDEQKILNALNLFFMNNIPFFKRYLLTLITGIIFSEPCT